MLYLSARQMWHDAFYQRSANEAAQELQRSNANVLRKKQVMNETQTSGPASNNPKIMHQVMAGKVQHAISTLPTHLQQLGNYCWAPRSEVMPTYKRQDEFMQYINTQVKAQFPEHYARNTSDVSILIIQILKYERAREEGRQQPPLDCVLAGAMALSKNKVRQKWQDVITFVRNQVRDYINGQPSITDQTLLSVMEEVGYTPKNIRKASVLADLAIRDFAHRDQAYLFSAGDKEREAVVPVGALYTNEYLAWRMGTARSNWKRDWADTYEQMLTVLGDMAGKALKPIVEVKAV